MLGLLSCNCAMCLESLLIHEMFSLTKERSCLVRKHDFVMKSKEVKIVKEVKKK